MGGSRLALLLVAALATSPVLAQKQSLADRVGRLEQQSANEDSASGRANVELLNRLTQMQTEVQALRNQVDTLGLSVLDASKRVSTHAADYLGVGDRGRLATGAWADVVVLDRDLNLQSVYVEGHSIEHTDAR